MNPSQRISPDQWEDSNLLSFGSSMDNLNAISGNNYPGNCVIFFSYYVFMWSLRSHAKIWYFFLTGIAVGSFQSERAFLLIARPVIRLNMSLSVSENIPLRNGICVGKDASCGCLSLKIKYTGEDVPSNICM